MSLKGPVSFLKRCYAEVHGVTPLAYLAHKALQLGLGRENTQGHIKQAWGAAQQFLQQYPEHKSTIRSSPPHLPFQLQGSILDDWRNFFGRQRGKYGPGRFGYSWDTLRGYLTPKYGGRRTGGGGGDNEFEIVIRLAAEFL